MTDTITLPRAEAKTILRALRTFDAGAMIKAEQMLVAALAQQAEQDPETAMIDAAMVEMKNIVPPLRRSECRKLIRAALAAAPKGGV